MRYVRRRDSSVRETVPQRVGQELHVAFVPHPPFLPAIVVIATGGPEVIDEIAVGTAGCHKRGNGGAAANKRAGGAVAANHLLRARWTGDPTLGRQD